MDVLSDVLRAVRLCGSVFFTAECFEPWAAESPGPDQLASVLPEADHIAVLNILVAGQCLVDCAEESVTLRAGDLAVFPRGHVHTMRSNADAAATRLEPALPPPSPDAIAEVQFGGSGRRARLICGYLNCTQRFAPLFEALPAMLIVPRASSRWLDATVQFTIEEAAGRRPGNTAMLARLAEIMFVEIVREQLQQVNDPERGWLAALKDPQVGQALRLLHAQPTRSWTVNRLAHEVGMSRSALAQRFVSLLGDSPMKYLLGWRMQIAKQLLRDRPDNIESIAQLIGYESEPAFNRAFKKATGSPPAAWRRMAARASSE